MVVVESVQSKLNLGSTPPLGKGREQENFDSPENIKVSPYIPPLIRGVRGVIPGTVARRVLPHLALRQKQFQRER
jgi:hypothetical protein